MSKTQRSQRDLNAAAEHVAYEIRMLISIAQRLKPEPDPGTAVTAAAPDELEVRNGLLEAFTLHVRNLWHFLWPLNPRNRNDDILAEHYGGEPAAWDRTDPSGKGTELCHRVNKEVAHLTYTRTAVGPEAKGWDCISIAVRLVDGLVAFREAAGTQIPAELSDAIGEASKWKEATVAAERSTSNSGEERLLDRVARGPIYNATTTSPATVPITGV